MKFGLPARNNCPPDFGAVIAAAAISWATWRTVPARSDAPAAPGVDVLIRGLTLTSASDHETIATTDRLFDGLYEHTRRHLMTGRPPA